jgi:hypothetical protein
MLWTYNTMRNSNAALNAKNKVKKSSVYSYVGTEFLKVNCYFQTILHFAVLLMRLFQQ